jgi:hypothetical protein
VATGLGGGEDVFLSACVPHRAGRIALATDRRDTTTGCRRRAQRGPLKIAARQLITVRLRELEDGADRRSETDSALLTQEGRPEGLPSQ